MKKLFIILLLFIAGCDMFTTRDPASPENRPQNYLTPTTPDIILANMKESFKDGYVEYYIECFADPTFITRKFKFIPSGSAGSSYPAFSDWNLDGEKQYFNKLKTIIASGSSVELTFSNQVFNPQGDSTVVTADYHISFTARDSGFPSDYQGYLQFKMFLDRRNQWVIVEWQDIKKENYNSWSDLKGRLY